jgi:2-haloalkanoic acid dehalogenase type II
LHRIRAITLDLDDTLWEIGPVIVRAEDLLWQHLTEHCPRIPGNFSAEDLHQMRLSVVAEFPHHGHDFRFLRKKVLEYLAREAGYSIDIVEPAYAVFDRARNDIDLFPDVLPHLQTLAENFALVALTNGNANLKTIGIEHLFHDVVTASDVGVAKPDKDIFEIAVSRSGFSAAETLHVGDHPEIDVDGARQAGLRTAWMNRSDAGWPVHLPRPDAIVSTVTDLLSVLETATRCMRGKEDLA